MKEAKLARRAKGVTLDETVADAKKKAKSFEDVVDEAILLYSTWSSHSTDVLRLPSLASWTKSKPFIGGDAAAEAVLTVAMQQINLTALLLTWRGSVKRTVASFKVAKKALRELIDGCNAYTEVAIDEKAAVERHKAATAAAEKATAAVGEAEKAQQAEQEKEGASAEPTPSKQLASLVKQLETKKQLEAKAASASTAAAEAREAAEKALLAARTAATEGAQRLMGDANRALNDAFTTLRSAQEELGFKSKGLLSSPEFVEQVQAAWSAGGAQATPKQAGAVEEVAALGEVVEGAEAQEAQVAVLLGCIEATERATRLLSKRLGKWVKYGLPTALGPACEGGGVKRERSEEGVVSRLAEQITSPEIRALVTGALLDGRSQVERAFVSGPVVEMEAATKELQTALGALEKRCKSWRDGWKKEADLQAKVERLELAAARAETQAEKLKETAALQLSPGEKAKAESAVAHAKAASGKRVARCGRHAACRALSAWSPPSCVGGSLAVIALLGFPCPSPLPPPLPPSLLTPPLTRPLPPPPLLSPHSQGARRSGGQASRAGRATSEAPLRVPLSNEGVPRAPWEWAHLDHGHVCRPAARVHAAHDRLHELPGV